MTTAKYSLCNIDW